VREMARNLKSGNQLGALDSARRGLLPFQHGQVLLRLCGRTAANKIAKCEDERVGDRVDAAGALLPAFYQATFKQEIQVLGYVWLISFEIFDQIGDGLFRSRQRLQNAKPEGLAKIPKASSHQFQCLARECDLAHVAQTITLCRCTP
jgi:hypothetical protein